MSKELEILESLFKGASRHQAEHGIKVGHAMLIQARYEYLKKLLTPPTAEEVCEELNKWYSEIVNYIFIYGVDDFSYDVDTKRFYKRMINSPHEMTMCRINELNCMELREPLPPHLITLIGRFYEGLEQ